MLINFSFQGNFTVSETVREKLKRLCILDKRLKKLNYTVKVMEAHLEEVGPLIRPFTPHAILFFRLVQQNLLLVDAPVQPFTDEYLLYMVEVEEQNKWKKFRWVLQEEIDDLQVEILTGIYGQDKPTN